MEEQINYRLLLILENIPHAAQSYQVRLDSRILELTDDEPILAVYTEVGDHNIEVSSSPTVRESASFRVHPGQRITKVFVRPTAHKIDLEIDFGARPRFLRNRAAEEAEERPAPAPASAQEVPRRGTRAAWLVFMLMLGLVCGLLLSLAIWPARSRGAVVNPPRSTETPATGTASYTVEIRNVRRATDATGEPAIVVAYAWTNNSDGTINAAGLFQAKAFQGGVQLDAAEIYDVGLYDPTAYTRELRPGATTELQATFRLTSERIPIEFEVTPLPDVPGEAVLEEFVPSELDG